MEGNNIFSKKMREKSTEELQSIIQSKDYVNEARLAAIAELENRGAEDNESIAVSRQQIENQIARENKPLGEPEETWSKAPKDIPPTVKWAVYFIFGALCINFLVQILNLTGIQYEIRINSSENLEYALWVIVFLIAWFFVYNIRRKRNWARILFALMVVYSSYNIVTAQINLYRYFQFVNLPFLIGPVINFAAACLLFFPMSNKWFSTKKEVVSHTDLLDQLDDSLEE